MKKKKYIILGIVIFIIALLIGVIAYANHMLNKINYTEWDDSQTTEIEEVEIDTEEIKNLTKLNPDDVHIKEVDPLDSIPDISNILLIGEENIHKDKRGRTDSMMILTINKIDKSIKLTSLMRDSYVKIPNYKDNRLNAAYSIGGVPLLKETIETNYGITLDNTVLVNFKTFEKIIDILGGVDIELTQNECDYLNTQNFVSKDNRILNPGINTLNGNQALGYARIRYVKGIDGELNDFGRTNRQRTVLKTIFNKYKKSDLNTLLKLMNEVLPYITTDISKSDIINYLTAIVSMMPDEIETFRLPIDNGYEAVSIRQMAVLNLDWDKNREALKNFIYNNSTNTKNTSNTQDTSDTN